MRFLITSSIFDDYDKIASNYPCMQKYNWDESEVNESIHENVYVTINTLDELLQFMKDVGEPIIVSSVPDWRPANADYEIEIYDGYRE